MAIGMLIVRLVVGLLFVGHGTQKLFGWFGGGGPQGTEGMVGSLGYRPARPMAYVSGLVETTGGALLALGLLTPLAGALLVGQMTSAILSVHLRRGLWNQNGGYEYPLTLIAVATAAAFGPGRYSLDALIGFGWNHRIAGILAFTVGVVVAVLVNATRRPPTPVQEHRDEPERRAA